MDINSALTDYELHSFNKTIKDDVSSVDELRKQFIDFMNQQYKKRRNADDFSISLTGMTNQQRYELQMNDLLSESADIPKDKIDLAKSWILQNNIQMVYPTDDIDSQFNKFMDQPKDARRKADWRCTEIFGCDNTTLYNMIKKQQSDLSASILPDSIYDLGSKLVELDNTTADSWLGESKIHFEQGRILDKLSLMTDQSVSIRHLYMPYFTPAEINKLASMYSDEVVDDECNSIYEEYVKFYNGYNHSFDPLKWNHKVRSLLIELTSAMNIDRKNTIKQSLVRIGWNPEIKYTAENLTVAKERIESSLTEMYSSTSILDCTRLFEEFDDSDVEDSAIITEASKNKKLKPISIVLVRGNSLFSDMIVKFTDGPFSHAALCIDEDFKKLYSFNASNHEHKGGFSLESISNYPKDNRVAVYSFFVTQEQYDKINATIQQLLLNVDKSSYSFLNILALPFKDINLNMPDKMICSQFVDRMLKLCKIDLTGVDSAKVTPNYLYSQCISNSKIYKIYDGAVKDFNNAKATRYLKSFSKKSKPLSESATVLYEYCVNQYLYPVISEARSLPVEFDDNGDVLLNKPIFAINYEAEYSASHKLLMEYEKSGNIDGMKYELCRLHLMNYMIEKVMYSNNPLYVKKEQHINTRARILNDYRKYLKYVLSKDPSFNFGEYYSKSPFSINTVKIKKGTLKQLKDLFRYIL